MITSAHNPKIQRLRALISKKSERDQASVFVAEGVRLLEEALKNGWDADLVLYSEDLSERGQAMLEAFRGQGSEVESVPPHLLKSLSDTETPQGILAVLRQRELPLPKTLNFVVVLDQLRDPGNVGTLLRTAAAARAQAVLLTPGSTDAFSPKVLRAGMGAHFRLPIRTLPVEEIIRLCRPTNQSGLQLLVSEVENGQPIWDVDLRKPCALVIGGEANGVSYELRQAADLNVHIPMPGNTESLNAAAAASILLFEIVRQRRA